ncbi:Ribokinase-like protein [Lipomyces arxii]|uniref:Ribokinase-like protein n=1 Tax=Lipomyces arxii TaxID=56418 RepID=UPI0034CE275C
MSAHITVFGSLNYDLVVSTPRVPNGGETILCDSFATHCGGKGANQALACRRLTPRNIGVRMVGRVGLDSFGDQLKSGLFSAGVDVAFVERVGPDSGIAVILVERSGQNRILVNAGANGTFTPDDVKLELFEHEGQLTSLLVLQNELPLPVVLAAIDLASSHGIKIVYNPSPMDMSIMTPEVISKISYLVVNESELSAMLGQSITDEQLTDQDTLIPYLLKFHKTYDFAGTIVVTLGGSGIVYSVYDKTAGFVEPIKALTVVDTTAAGDSFLGAFVGGIVDHKDIESSIKRGAAAGCLAVQKKGAAESIPILADVQKLLQ